MPHSPHLQSYTTHARAHTRANGACCGADNLSSVHTTVCATQLRSCGQRRASHRHAHADASTTAAECSPCALADSSDGVFADSSDAASAALFGCSSSGGMVSAAPPPSSPPPSSASAPSAGSPPPSPALPLPAAATALGSADGAPSNSSACGAASAPSMPSSPAALASGAAHSAASSSVSGSAKAPAAFSPSALSASGPAACSADASLDGGPVPPRTPPFACLPSIEGTRSAGGWAPPPPTPPTAGKPSIGGRRSREVGRGATSDSSWRIFASLAPVSSRSREMRSRCMSSSLRNPSSAVPLPNVGGVPGARPFCGPSSAAPSEPGAPAAPDTRDLSCRISRRSSLISRMSAVFSCITRRLSVRCSSESLASLRLRLSTVFSRYSRWRAASRSRSS
mmetsp:Transcript_36831/g.108612  ORF Transcript_36831/g.108612 Transcript_36831/m.108612 type:complete len:396 (+) Transcript_36831:135-1322(+)